MLHLFAGTIPLLDLVNCNVCSHMSAIVLHMAIFFSTLMTMLSIHALYVHFELMIPWSELSCNLFVGIFAFLWQLILSIFVQIYALSTECLIIILVISTQMHCYTAQESAPILFQLLLRIPVSTQSRLGASSVNVRVSSC
jgi:hypothetical protein